VQESRVRSLLQGSSSAREPRPSRGVAGLPLSDLERPAPCLEMRRSDDHSTLLGSRDLERPGEALPVERSASDPRSDYYC
jgi:hypothetical protein